MKRKGRRRVLLGAALLLISSLFSWGKVASFLNAIHVTGYKSRGLFAAGIGLALLVGGLLIKGTPGTRYAPLLSMLAALAGWSAGWVASTESIQVSDILGLLLASLGALIAVIGGLTKVPPEPEPESEPVPVPEPTVEAEAGVVVPHGDE